MTLVALPHNPGRGLETGDPRVMGFMPSIRSVGKRGVSYRRRHIWHLGEPFQPGWVTRAQAGKVLTDQSLQSPAGCHITLPR